MTTERVVEIPWALQHLPQSGRVLDVGSCEAGYLAVVQQPGRELHCIDPRECGDQLPRGAVFHRQSLIGNDLPRESFDAVLLLSTLEHIGLPCYGQEPFPHGDELALAEVRRLLKPGAPAIVTVPAGLSKLASWYRQYSPVDIARLFGGWSLRVRYWGFDGVMYQPIAEAEVLDHDYRDRHDENAGAGAVAGILARRPA